MNSLAIPIFSWKKLNTDGVESPCERFPRVGSFLANPGLSKEQLVPSCEMRTFVVIDVFIGILAQRLRRCTMRVFILRNSSIGILAQYQRRCVVTTFIMVETSIEILA